MGTSKTVDRIAGYLGAGIGRRLVFSFVVLVLCLTIFTGLWLVKLAKTSLESQMRIKLVSIAQLVASGVGHDVIRLKANAGWEKSVYFTGLTNRLKRAQLAAGASKIYVFNRFFKNLVDTDETAVGQQVHHSRIRDLREVELAFSGKPTSSILFYSANDTPYMTGYAPIKKGDEVVAVVGVDIGVAYVDFFRTFLRSVMIFLVIGVALTMIVAWLMARSLTQPLQKLINAAREIGRGDLHYTVPKVGNDEIGYLARSMDEMRQGLSDRDNQLRQMLGGVAHEIRNPLGGIEIYAGLIADDLPDNDERKQHILKVIAEVRKLDSVISEFLSFAKPSSPDFEYVSLFDLTRDATFLLSPDLEKASIELEIDVHQKTVIWVDREQIKRVLFNLMKNGVQAMSQGGSLRIVGRELGDQILIDVSDTGHGVREELKNKIFQPFFTTRERGSGLGLAIVSRLIQDNGGRLTLDRSSPEGTCFRLSFPCVV